MLSTENIDVSYYNQVSNIYRYTKNLKRGVDKV